ncbi:MAG: ester cyclase [Chitinophagaceae bacterium]
MPNIQSSLLYKWFNDVWNSDNEAAIDNMLTTDAFAHGIVDENNPRGAEGFKDFYRQLRSQFHDVQISVDDVVKEENMESARTTVHAVHTATGKPVTFSGICMVKIEDGKIKEAWNQYDFLSLNQQVGEKPIAEAHA